MKQLLLSLFIIFCCTHLFAQNSNSFDFFINPKLFVGDSIKIWDTDEYHPCLYTSLSEHERDSFKLLIEERRMLFPGDSLTVTEHFRLWYPYLMRLNYQDPHYRVVPYVEIINKKFKENDIKIIPIDVLLINDTVVVSKSLDKEIHKGDRIISVNNVPVENYLEYYYKDRYVHFFMLQQYYHFAYAPYYKIELERKGEKLFVETEGMGYSDAAFKLTSVDWETKFFDKYGTGYIVLNKFYPNNSKLIKTLSAFIKDTQKKGYKNIIIDVRQNIGGNGHNFDELISIFTNKSSIDISKSKSIRVSEHILDDYDFLTKDMIGELYDLPEGEFYSSIPTNPKKYLGEMNYYVLVSRNTASMAASFVNILQYNGLAALVGEPLQNNALYFGEVILLGWKSRSNVEIYSTAYINEYTKNIDGQVYPDIEIPFVAKEFIEKDDDPIIERLLNIINEKTK